MTPFSRTLSTRLDNLYIDNNVVKKRRGCCIITLQTPEHTVVAFPFGLYNYNYLASYHSLAILAILILVFRHYHMRKILYVPVSGNHPSRTVTAIGPAKFSLLHSQLENICRFLRLESIYSC